MTSLDRLALIGLVALGVGLPAVIGILSGSILIPHNDDAGFRRVALTFLESGRLQLIGWTAMTLIGQVVFSAPFLWLLRGSPLAFAISGTVLAIICIVAGYDLARRVLSTPRAAFAMLNLLLVPGFLLYTTAFMTDLPALAGEVLCLALGAAALHRRDDQHRWRWLIAALAVGCWAFSVREFALAAPAAVLVAAFASDPRPRLGRYLAAGLIVLVSCVGIFVYASTIPGGSVSEIDPLAPASIAKTQRALVTLGLMLAPSLVLGMATWVPSWVRTGKARDAAIGAVGGLLAAGLLFGRDAGDLIAAGGTPGIFVGNVFVPEGAPGTGVLAGSRPLLFPSPVWQSFEIIAIIAAAAGLGLLGGYIVAERRAILRAADIRRPGGPLGSVVGLLAMFAAAFGAGTIAYGLFASMYDRYLWPLVLPLAILLLIRPTDADKTVPDPEGGRDAVPPRTSFHPASWLAGATMAVLGVASIALMLNSSAFDTARWRVGEDALARGFQPGTVDAGMEWVTFHATGVADIHAKPDGAEMYYSAWWPSFHQCAMVSSSLLDIPGFRLESANIDAYRLWLVAGPESPLYLYRVAGPGCP